MNTVTIRFSDGTEIDAEQNGTAFIVDEPFDIPDDLSDIEFIGRDEGPESIENGKFVECASIDGRFWFTIIEKSEDEIWKAEIENAICDLSKEN